MYFQITSFSQVLLGARRRGKAIRRELTPRVTAQYFKFIPKYWTKDAHACMKLEMYGCDSSEGENYSLQIYSVHMEMYCSSITLGSFNKYVKPRNWMDIFIGDTSVGGVR